MHRRYLERIHPTGVVTTNGKWLIKQITCYLFIISLTLVGILSGNRAITVLREQIPVERYHTIVIDAGHGGEDGGATSSSGRLESQYNLEIALRLDDLMQLLGYRTRMTRRTDTAIYQKGETIAQKKVDDLKQRVRISNSNDGNVLLSIHQNYFSQGQYSGAQVFYAMNDSSKNLANTLQQNLVTSLDPGNKRKAKAGEGIYLLEKRTGCGGNLCRSCSIDPGIFAGSAGLRICDKFHRCADPFSGKFSFSESVVRTTTASNLP